MDNGRGGGWSRTGDVGGVTGEGISEMKRQITRLEARPLRKGAAGLPAYCDRSAALPETGTRLSRGGYAGAIRQSA